MACRSQSERFGSRFYEGVHSSARPQRWELASTGVCPDGVLERSQASDPGPFQCCLRWLLFVLFLFFGECLCVRYCQICILLHILFQILSLYYLYQFYIILSYNIYIRFFDMYYKST